MMKKLVIFAASGAKAMTSSRVLTLLMVFGLLGLIGCGGTKVYTINKTLVHGNSIYNLSSTQRLSGRMEATMPDGEKRDVTGMDKGAVNALLDEHGDLAVSSIIAMDSEDLVYETRYVDSYSDYRKMAKNLDSAMKKVHQFMANKKSTQLKL